MSICIAPNRQKSSEVLAAKQMSFELFTNVSMESDEVRSSTGSLFHVAGPSGPDTAKLRWPMVVLVPGTTSVPLFVDRSCHLPTTELIVSVAPASCCFSPEFRFHSLL